MGTALLKELYPHPGDFRKSVWLATGVMSSQHVRGVTVPALGLVWLSRADVLAPAKFCASGVCGWGISDITAPSLWEDPLTVLAFLDWRWASPKAGQACPAPIQGGLLVVSLDPTPTRMFYIF